MTSMYIYYFGLLLFIAGAIIPLIYPQKMKRFAYIFPTVGACAFAAFGMYLLFDHPLDISAVSITPLLGFVFRGDAISGFFILLISILTFSVSVYSMGYTKNMANKGVMGVLFNTFILSMYAVILSGNVITFLISWETMSIISYLLVTFDREEESASAGLLYAIMTHVGTAFILTAFLLLYKYTGHMDFAGIKEATNDIPAGIKTIVFVFAVIGFGTKAGIVPLHTWLPRAHPAAPSNISSLMSGVMIKTGIYGILRIVVDILGVGPEWWGIAIIVIGAMSAVLGILYALTENDMKRFLAYSSIENIGIILLGIGASMVLASNGLHTLSAIAMTAGLYHTLNHTLFKGLLFLGAGSVVHATHSKNMEEMGGLIKLMPYTAFFFLIGSVSICALPLFNGFVSEWLTFQALLFDFKSASAVAKLIAPMSGAALAFTGAMAIACFVKVFGISFLGMPRSQHAENAKETSTSMLAGMGFLSLFCLLTGIFPGHTIKLFSSSVFLLTGADYSSSGMGILSMREISSSISPLSLFIVMISLFIAAVFLVRIFGGKRKITYGNSWDSGIPSLTSRMQYTATAFTNPIRVTFKKIYLSKRHTKVSYALKPYFAKAIEYRDDITPFFEKYIYQPVTDFIHSLAGKVKHLQSGDLHLYLGYILATLILLLIFWS
ncbi:MAG: hydrogenase 4 subunit B [Candidatus Scalindua sp.]|nr:hydrogenase 4 subunit B [Candidatus Scalindua sp.]